MSEENKVSLHTFYGQKAGMTRIFDDSGKHVPVTVIKLIPNVISQVKTQEKDGYEAYQIAFQEKREKLVNKPKKGHLAKAGVDKAFNRFSEVKTPEVNPENLGKEISLTDFPAQTWIDVTGISKGKGFSGVIKRHNFSGGPMAHGSKFHRTTGSIGNRATPGRVFKLKKMPGHMGVQTKTIQNLQVVELNQEQGYLLVKGSVPGSKDGFVKITKALKK
ncbi:MAG: 50S ribosomal protein L3 [Halobacteriovoraceae bacterium]|nr:50S ribosomal protein L3 [Halobacteriovoraceae bacterium]|tara:strand:- start:31428 stop:32081 length:654 start_codon:yes stop_codon:yes gene_type:complete